MICLDFTKSIQNLLVFLISEEGDMVSQHLKSITKPKTELQPHLALQPGTLATCVALFLGIAIGKYLRTALPVLGKPSQSLLFYSE